MKTFDMMGGVSIMMCACALVACSPAPVNGEALAHGAGDPNSVDGTADSADGSDPSATTDDSGDTSDTAPPAKPKNACAKETKASTCLDCCSARTPDAVDIYTGALSACLCKSPGTCAAECATTLCAGTKVNAACSACLSNAPTCDDKAIATCEADPTCAPLLTCAADAKCALKP